MHSEHGDPDPDMETDRDYERITRADIDAILAGDDTVAIGCLARKLSFDNNIQVEYGDAERTLLGLARHPDHWVRLCSYSSLMTLCSRTPQFDNPGLAYTVIVEGLYDGDCQILRFADGAAGYVAYFQGWKFPDRPRRRG